MNQKPNEPPLVDGAFLRTLQNYRKGEVLTELADALRRVMAAVSQAKKPGTLVLSLKISPNGEMYGIVPSVDLKLPREPKVAALFYLDENYNLVREDPNQQTLPLQTLDGGATVENQTATIAKQAEA